MLGISETFGRADKPNIQPPIDGYKIWRTERSGSDKGGGGLSMIYRDNLTAHEWNPLVPPSQQYIMQERQWLLIDNNNQKERCAFLHVYIACQNSDNDSYIQWNEDLFHLITQEAIRLRKQGFVVLAMGDFNSHVGKIPGLEKNTPGHNHNTPKFLNFVNEVNLIIINTLPISKGLFTRFMNSSSNTGSKSLIDYGLIDSDHSNTVTSFIIDSEARFDCGSDHALLECKIQFGSKPKISWSVQEPIQYNFKPDSNFTDYQATLDQISSSITIKQFASLSADQMLPHISETITQSAKKSFGLKIKKRKNGRRLPKNILAMINAKNIMARELNHACKSSSPLEIERMQHDLDSLKHQIQDSISGIKLHRRHRLRSKLLLADPSRKKFWRFLKNQIKSAGTISAVYDTSGNMVFDQNEIEDAVLQHFQTIFAGKRTPVYLPGQPPVQIELSLIEMTQIITQQSPSFSPHHFEDKICSPYTFLELNQILEKLPSGKATGYDLIPNELLKQSSFQFKQYLIIFLNKIIDEGVVPEDLNLGKCMLIFKVF